MERHLAPVQFIHTYMHIQVLAVAVNIPLMDTIRIVRPVCDVCYWKSLPIIVIPINLYLIISHFPCFFAFCIGRDRKTTHTCHQTYQCQRRHTSDPSKHITFPLHIPSCSKASSFVQGCFRSPACSHGPSAYAA